jgi:hypothetical protein
MSAMNAAPCSWRVVMNRIELSNRVSRISTFSAPEDIFDAFVFKNFHEQLGCFHG